MQNQLAEMTGKAKAVLQNSYCPYSNYSVAACLLSDADKLYVGTNVENASFSLTLCAEAVALGAFVSAGERNIKKIVLMATGDKPCYPCGACRQRLYEFSSSATLLYVFNTAQDQQAMLTLEKLLPYPFTLENTG